MISFIHYSFLQKAKHDDLVLHLYIKKHSALLPHSGLINNNKAFKNCKSNDCNSMKKTVQ